MIKANFGFASKEFSAVLIRYGSTQFCSEPLLMIIVSKQISK